MATAGAQFRGAGLVIGVETIPNRQALARSYGADEIVDFMKEDVVVQVMELTSGAGVHTVIEALGASADHLLKGFCRCSTSTRISARSDLTAATRLWTTSD
jgi:threonine dehydrogenase-like Zn-dependent dehydrogenase